MENIKNTGERIKTRGPTPCPRGWGARLPPWACPCLVGPLELHRPQLQLHILAFREKKIREKKSSCFPIRSRRQALISLGRADPEFVRGSGEGDSSPSSSSTILHHQFHDAHRRALCRCGHCRCHRLYSAPANGSLLNGSLLGPTSHACNGLNKIGRFCRLVPPVRAESKG